MALIVNPTVGKDIVDEINHLENSAFLLDEPVPFKQELKLYPITVRNYNEFLLCSECCTLNKNDSEEGILMTHLDYLVSLMKSEEGKRLSMYFSRLVELVFRIKNGIRCAQCGDVITFEQYAQMTNEERENYQCKCGKNDFEEVIRYNIDSNGRTELTIQGVKITSKDFNRFRQIVMYQNLPDYKDDSAVHAEIREDQRLRQELLAKKSGGAVHASLEKKIIGVSINSNYKINELYDMTIRKFLITLTTIDDLIVYQSDRLARMSGLVSCKEPLEHWLYKREKGSIYGEAVTEDSYTNKVNGNASTSK